MKLDGKFHGIIVKNKDQSIVPQDEWIVFLAKDDAVPAMLDFYLEECKRRGAKQDQIDAIHGLINRVSTWRGQHISQCHVADVHPGEIQA